MLAVTSEPLSWKMLHRVGVAAREQSEHGAFNPDQVTYVVRVDGRLDLDRLATAWTQLQKRHPVLGSRLDVGAGLWCLEDPVECPLTVSVLPGAERSADAALHEMTAAVLRPFDFTRGPLHRLHAVEISDVQSLVGVAVDHLISDAWSIQVLFAELWQLYESPDADLPAVETTAPELVAQERAWLATIEGNEALDRQVERLSSVGAQPAVVFPGMRLDAASHERSHGARFTLGREELDRLRQCGILRGLASGTVAHAALAGALHLLTGQEQLGTIMALAHRSRRSSHRTQGWLADNAVVLTQAETVKSARFLAHFGDAVIQALGQSKLPHMAIVARADPGLVGAPTPQPTAGFNGGVALSSRFPVRDPSGLKLTEIVIPGGWGYRAIMAHAAESDDGLQIKVSLKQRWFEPSAVDLLRDQMRDLLVHWSSTA